MTQESKQRFDASDIILKHLENVKNWITFQMDAYGRNASGKHVKSLQTSVTMGSGYLSGLYSFNFMETGRGGGKVPQNFRSIIYQWSIDKGISIKGIPYKRKGEHKYTPEERARWSFAGAVAHKIMTSGTTLFRSGVREDIYSSVINAEVAAIQQESTLRLGEMIENINKNSI